MRPAVFFFIASAIQHINFSAYIDIPDGDVLDGENGKAWNKGALPIPLRWEIKIMSADICSKCKEYFRDTKVVKKLSLLEANKGGIGNMIRCAGDQNDKSMLYYAPAGNFPDDPVVTVCGLATSVQAKEFMQCSIANGEEIEEACLQSVYIGDMAVNLCLMLNALGIDKLISSCCITIRNNSKSLINKSLSDISKEDFGKSGYFTCIPPELQLTQATCCWSKNGSSKFLDEWIGYSKGCREYGYLRAVLQRFIGSKNAKVFFFLGRPNLCNLDLVKELLPVGHRIKIMSPAFSGKIAGKAMSSYENMIKQLQSTHQTEKIICYLHHPANAKHVYNNKKESGKSILYRYFEKPFGFKIHVQDCYGKISLKNDSDYYQKLKEDINCLIRN